MNTEEILKDAAAAAEKPTAQRKERKPKVAPMGEVSDTPPAASKKERKPKMVPKLNEDGTPVLNEDGTPVMVEAQKKVRGPKSAKFNQDGRPIDINLEAANLSLVVVKQPSAKEGSKRAGRQAALDGASTVQDFFIHKGLVKDLYRYVKSGCVELSLNGKRVTHS